VRRIYAFDGEAALEVDLGADFDRVAYALTPTPESDQNDKDYSGGFASYYLVSDTNLRPSYDYGEPGNEPDPITNPRTLLPGSDNLVTAEGQPIRVLWDTPLFDQILAVEKALKGKDVG